MVFESDLVILIEALLGVMFDSHLFKAKNNVFDHHYINMLSSFDVRKMMFEFVR